MHASPRSVAEAVAAESAGPVEYLYFWGHRPQSDGSVGRGCLSQWWSGRFTDDRHEFASAEHYMMAHKAWLFGDTATADRILAAADPAAAKRLGRQVRDFDQGRWEAERFAIVVRGNVLKFGQDPALLRFLLATGGKVLVEASPRDRIWGIGLGKSNPDAASARTWKGLNLLGFALMEARERLAP
ncbi:NADAR family protein [Glycomyces sp. NPDC046736]|uniref:NADAR family protein n=1 Tax=Glycomyces sp. NPDC046736 TaxID=3155615 RepID=UPI0034031326